MRGLKGQKCTWQFRPTVPLSQSTQRDLELRQRHDDPTNGAAKAIDRLHLLVDSKQLNLEDSLIQGWASNAGQFDHAGRQACHQVGVPPDLVAWLLLFVETSVAGYRVDALYHHLQPCLGDTLVLTALNQELNLHLHYSPTRKGWSLTTEGVGYAVTDHAAERKEVARMALCHRCFFPDKDAPHRTNEGHQQRPWLAYQKRLVAWGHWDTLTVNCSFDGAQEAGLSQRLFALCKKAYTPPRPRSWFPFLQPAWLRRYAGILLVSGCLGAGVVGAEVMHALPTSQVGLAQWMVGCVVLLLLGHVVDRWRSPRPRPTVQIITPRQPPSPPETPEPQGPVATPDTAGVDSPLPRHGGRLVRRVSSDGSRTT